jgi:hypothetical protein
MSESDERSTSWFTRLEPWLDRSLNCGEVAIVLLIAVIVLAATCYQAIWIAHVGAPTRQLRLVSSLKMLNENWKAGLLILVPLFYRTIRAFLERVEKAFGMEAPRKPVDTAAGMNPAQREEDHTTE